MSSIVAGASESAVRSSISKAYSTPATGEDSFGAILLAASAGISEPVKNSSPDIASIKEEYEKWERTSGQAEMSPDTLAADSATFEKIVDKAAAQGGYDDPQAFLASLSTSEVAALQRIHRLADPINPGSLTREGALNLLYAPGQAQDIDHDGFEMVGKGKMWTFPPPDAPDSVKQAWNKTVATQGGDAVMRMSICFLPIVDPGQGASGNAYLGPDADYAGLVRKAIEAAKFNQSHDESWQRENRKNQIQDLEDFLANLENA